MTGFANAGFAFLNDRYCCNANTGTSRDKLEAPFAGSLGGCRTVWRTQPVPQAVTGDLRRLGPALGRLRERAWARPERPHEGGPELVRRTVADGPCRPFDACPLVETLAGPLHA